MPEAVGAEKGERTPNRQGYRAGCYLSFTARDIELIHAGLQAGRAHDVGPTLDGSGVLQATKLT